MVVGYANTVPVVLEQLTDSKVEVDEDAFDTLFVVVLPSPGQPRLLRLHYGDGANQAQAVTADSER